MRARFLLVTALLLTGLLLIPAAAAQQPNPKINAIAKWEVDHEMVLPESGRGDMGVILDVTGIDFVCVQAMKIKVNVNIDTSFPKWAGASMVPRNVPTAPAQYFVFDGGNPGTGTVKHATGSPNTEAKLNIAWDLESAPKKNAMQEYQIKAEVKIVEQGVCSTSSPPVNAPKSAAMVVRMPDRIDDINATSGAEICDDNPFASGCPGATASQAANDGGNAPGPDVLIILLGLVGTVGIWRRNRRQ
jgi:hypothetical protein